MGMMMEKYGFEVVPSLTLVRDTMAERLQHRVELVEEPPCFEVMVYTDSPGRDGPPGVVRHGIVCRLTPSERALEVVGHWHLADATYESPAYGLLCRALKELGGRAAEVELDRFEFRQRFDFEGRVPEALEVHERIVALGGATPSDSPPRVLRTSTFLLTAPGLLPVVNPVGIHALRPGEIELWAGMAYSLIHAAADALEALGGRHLDYF